MSCTFAKFSALALAIGLLVAGGVAACAADAAAPQNVPPQGFEALFNGKDLSGWHGLSTFDPHTLQNMPAKKRAAKLAKDNADMKKHWRVENGEIINDGHGVYLTTDKDYGNFELWVQWKMMAANGDSGVYLRGYPQVQIWDPANPKEVANGAPKGSGGLWNDNPDNPGRFPRVKADRPVGQWNSFRIRMVGTRVTVHFNDQLVVDDAVLDNYFHRGQPILPTGPLQLQTHGSEMRFRNLYLRKLPAEASTREKADSKSE